VGAVATTLAVALVTTIRFFGSSTSGNSTESAVVREKIEGIQRSLDNRVMEIHGYMVEIKEDVNYIRKRVDEIIDRRGG